MSSVCVVQTKEKYKVTSALPEKHEELLRQSSNLMHLREVMLILLQRIVEHKIEVGNLHPIKKPLRRIDTEEITSKVSAYLNTDREIQSGRVIQQSAFYVDWTDCVLHFFPY